MTEHIDQEVFAAYVAGMLDPEARAAIEEHVSECHGCERRLVRATEEEMVIRKVARAYLPRPRGMPLWPLGGGLVVSAALAAALLVPRAPALPPFDVEWSSPVETRASAETGSAACGQAKGAHARVATRGPLSLVFRPEVEVGEMVRVWAYQGESALAGGQASSESGTVGLRLDTAALTPGGGPVEFVIATGDAAPAADILAELRAGRIVPGYAWCALDLEVLPSAG